MLLDAGFEDRCPSASYRIFSEELLVKPRTGDWRKTMLWCKSSISALLLRVSEANEVLSRYFASFWRPSIFEIKSFITPLLRTPPRGGRQGSPGSTLKCTAPYPRVEIKDVANEYYFRHDWAIKSLYYVKSRQWYEGLRCYLWPELSFFLLLFSTMFIYIFPAILRTVLTVTNENSLVILVILFTIINSFRRSPRSLKIEPTRFSTRKSLIYLSRQWAVNLPVLWLLPRQSAQLSLRIL